MSSRTICASFSFSARSSIARRRRSCPRRRATSSTARNGFFTKSSAPASNARTISSAASSAVSTTTGEVARLFARPQDAQHLVPVGAREHHQIEQHDRQLDLVERGQRFGGASGRQREKPGDDNAWTSTWRLTASSSTTRTGPSVTEGVYGADEVGRKAHFADVSLPRRIGARRRAAPGGYSNRRLASWAPGRCRGARRRGAWRPGPAGPAADVALLQVQFVRPRACRSLADRRRERLEPHGPTIVVLVDDARESAVHLVEAGRVDLELLASLGDDGDIIAGADHLGVVADAAEQAVGDAGRAAQAA